MSSSKIASTMKPSHQACSPRPLFLACLAVTLVLAAVGESRAEIIFDFDSGTGQGTSSDPTLTVSDWMGSGVNGMAFDGPGTSGSAVRGHGFDVGNSAANSSYYYFEVTPATDTLLQLTTLGFDEYAHNGPGPLRGPTTWQVVVNGTEIGSPQAANFGSYGATHQVDLSSLSFLNETVRIEFHGWGAFVGNQHNEWYLDNVTLGFQTAAIPEPSTNLLLACSLGAFCFARRRSRRAVTA
jgi:hypothetical protein